MGEMKLSSPNYDNLLEEFVATRIAAGLSQYALAEKSGTIQANIGRLESKKAIPRIDKFMALLEAMGKTLAIVDMQDTSE